MFKINKKILKILLIAIVLSALTVGSYFYFSKQTTSKIATTKPSFEFSHPDTRPEVISGKIVTLKRIRPEYYKDYFNMVNDPQVLKQLPWSKKINFNFIKWYLDDELNREKNRLTFIYMVFDNKDNRLVGSIEVREFDPEDDSGNFGCWLNSKYWGDGRLQEAAKLLASEYFKIYKNIDKFNAYVDMDNLRSYFGLKKAGFKLVKILHSKNKPDQYLLEYYREQTSQPVLNNSKSSTLNPD